MQFFKFMPLVCAAIFCAGFISIRADDNPAQAAARAALDAKMRELDSGQAPANEKTPPVAVTPSVVTPEQPAAMPADTEAQARALQALRQKMSELDQHPAEMPAPPANVRVETPAIATAAKPEVKPVVVATPEKPANVNYPGKQMGLPPIVAPDLPITADKQAQLQALLIKYKADQVSPEEYQTQRAAILAAP